VTKGKKDKINMSISSELQAIIADHVRESKKLRELIERWTGEPNAPQSVLSTLQFAQHQLDTAYHYLDHASRNITRDLPLQNSDVTESVSLYRSAVGNCVTNVMLRSSRGDSVSLQPFYAFETIHQAIRGDNFFSTTLPSQELLSPLLCQRDCSVFVETDDESPARGFTTVAFLGLATKAMNALDWGQITKSVYIVRNQREAEVIDKLKQRVPLVQVVNLATPEPPLPSQLRTDQPRIIVCLAAHLLNSTVQARDIVHLVWDNYDGTELAGDMEFASLRDAVYRGASSHISRVLTPRLSTIHAHVWMFQRCITCHNVQPFSFSQEVQEYFDKLPTSTSNVLYTSQTNAHVRNAKHVVNSLDQVPPDADYLVVSEIPSTEDEIRVLLRNACAKVVTLICNPSTPKALHFALHREREGSTANQRAPLDEQHMNRY